MTAYKTEITNVILIITLLLTGLVQAAGVQRTGHIQIVEITSSTSDTLDLLTSRGYNISNVSGNVITVYATESEVGELRNEGYDFDIVGHQIINKKAYIPRQTVVLKALGSYQSYESMTQMLQDFAADYPDICRLSSLGQSVEGRELWAMMISDNPDNEEDEPEFKYVSTMHGSEPVGTEMCLYLIDRLLSDYGSDDRITSLIDKIEIWIVPLMNPDGFEHNARQNADGLDLNREFPVYPQDYEDTVFDGEAVGSENHPIEVQHVMEWSAENSFVLSANIHTGTLVVNYPYDDDGRGDVDSPTPDDLLFEEISRRYSVHNLPMWNSTQFNDGITNGAVWYVIDGGMQDWNYRYLACNEVTLEISHSFKPNESKIADLWNDNEESMLSYMESVHMGVRGLVVDDSTGLPLWAKVNVEGNTQPVFTDPDVGDYHRMLLPGVYTITISANDYFTRKLRNVAVSEQDTTRVDVEMADADIDNDEAIGASDIQTVINAALDLPVEYNCDLDGEGVGATDLQLIINAVLLENS